MATSTIGKIIQNFIPYQGTPGTPSENRSIPGVPTLVDPMIARYLALKGEEAGIGRVLPVAMYGAETTFGNEGEGRTNPLHFKYTKSGPKLSNREDAIASPHMGRLKETISELSSQGMPKSVADRTYDYLFQNGVRPFAAADRSIEEKISYAKDVLQRHNKPETPENLAWIYQGTGTPNKNEIPGGFAYGAPVVKTKSGTGHSAVVGQIIKDLVSSSSELGNYIRGVE